MTGSSVLIEAFKFLLEGAEESASTDDPRAPNVFPPDLEVRNARPALVVAHPLARS